jgi:branched-chain amino acid transport system ATP-binding protein
VSPLLSLEGVTAFYGGSQALFGVDLDVGPGEVVALMGRNGMGKTTTVRTISALLRPRAGRITFAGHETRGMAIHRVARLGVGLVPEGRRCFAPLTVEENLTAAARPGAWTQARVEALFPQLAERRAQAARTLSGGEQQMLAVGRALMSRPRLLLMDEPSLGLAPIVVDEIFRIIGELNADGTTVFLVEQNAHKALQVARRFYLMEQGRVTFSGTPGQLAEDEVIQRAYLGTRRAAV